MASGAQAHTQHTYDPANYYVWNAPGGFSVHLSLAVVRELALQIAKAGEIRGVLLGRSITTPFAATMAEDFLVIPASVDYDAACRAAALDGRELRVIGYFRSQAEGRLRLDASDVRTFERLFHDDGSIGLLIRVPRRGDGEAALFYWRDGRAGPRDFGFGFPFDEAKLAGGHPGWRFPDPLELAEEPVARSLQEDGAVRPDRQPGEHIRWFRLLPTTALVVAAIVITQLVWSKRGDTQADPPMAVDQPSLGLKVTTEPHQLEIRWNRAAPAVMAAASGTLRITEGGITEAVPFEASELREGYVAYTPKTNDVSIRLEVAGAQGGATAESIRVVAIP